MGQQVSASLARIVDSSVLDSRYAGYEVDLTYNIAMNDCCLKLADEYFYSNYPLESFQREDFLLTHLLDISKRWGHLLSLSAEQFYIRSTSSPTLGIDAETGILKCRHAEQRTEPSLLERDCSTLCGALA